MDYSWYDFSGNLGVAAIVIAYLLLQMGRMRSTDLWYSVLNTVGAGLIIISLIFDFNLSAMCIEGFWLLISLYGIVMYLRRSQSPKDLA